MPPPTTEFFAASSTAHTMSTTFFAEVLAGIASFRKRLFVLEEPLELPRDQWDRIWPYVGKIWVQNKKRISNEVKTVHYLCRLHSSKTWIPKDNRRRQRTHREAIGCGMRFKVEISATSVSAIRTGTCDTHCHDLESLDRQKKNSEVMALAAGQVSQGCKVAAVAANFTAKARPEDRVLLNELGGYWVNLKDVHNSAAVSKATNRHIKRIGAREGVSISSLHVLY